MSQPTPSGPFVAASGQRRWLVGVAIVTAVSVLQMIPQFFAGRTRGQLVLRLAFVAFELPVIMTALSFHYVLAERRAFGTMKTIAGSLAISAALGAGCALALHAISPDFPPFRSLPAPLPLGVVAGFGATMGIFQCGVWALAFIYPFAAEDARLRSLEAEKLRLEAEQLRAAAELARLRSQLEPHFLLNTLNAIAGLVTQDPREARRLIGCLGDLLRDALRDPDEMQTLGEEIAWLRRYAEILESRHSGKLRFRWEIAGEAGEVLLPRLLLQPLVENAVKHGALQRGTGGEVVVRARVVTPEEGSSPRVVCTVEDNGPGMPEGAPRSGAFGLRAVRRRLELRYTDASLRLESSKEGTRSIVELPRVVDRAEGAA